MIGQGNRLLNIAVATIMLALPRGETRAQDRDIEFPTNLQLIQHLSRQLADTTKAYVKRGDSVRVVVRPAETAWYIAGAIAQSFRDSGVFVTEAASAAYDIDIGLLNARVTYANARRNTLFGSRVLDRTVHVELNTKVVNRTTGEILLGNDFSRSVSDTVAISDVDRLENAGIPATHGILPSEGFFSSIIEPLVAMGAIAVAVYLLFHVRS